MAASSVDLQNLPAHQVFINFRGELRNGFISFLQSALFRNGINVFIDEDMRVGRPLNELFKKIEESRVALAVFSEKYAESEWCLNELVKINERKDEGKLVAIPIFYKVKVSDVKLLKEAFGDAVWKAHGDKGTRPDRIEKWKQALLSVSSLVARKLKENGKESEFVDKIVEDVKKELSILSLEERQKASRNTFPEQREQPDIHSAIMSREETNALARHPHGIVLDPKQLQGKLNFPSGSYLTGIHLTPSIDQIILERILYENFIHKHISSNFGTQLHGLDRLQRPFLVDNILETRLTEREYEFLRSRPLDRRMLFLDDMGIAQNRIVSSTERESEPMVNALERYTEYPVLESQGIYSTGSEVPPWFSHVTIGSTLQPQLPPQWWDGKFAWLGLCAVVSFRGFEDHTSSLSVQCKCEIKSEDCCPIRFTCVVGGWGEPGKEPHRIESDLVFVGYVSCLRIRKLIEGNQNFSGFTSTRASFEFFVIDDTRDELVRCEVVKCGLILVYAPIETDNIYWKANSDATRRRDDRFQHGVNSVVTSGRDDDGIHHEANSGVAPRRDEIFPGEANSDATSREGDNFYGESNSGVTPCRDEKSQNNTGNKKGCLANDVETLAGTSEEDRGNDVPDTTCFSFWASCFMQCCYCCMQRMQ